MQVPRPLKHDPDLERSWQHYEIFVRQLMPLPVAKPFLVHARGLFEDNCRTLDHIRRNCRGRAGLSAPVR